MQTRPATLMALLSRFSLAVLILSGCTALQACGPDTNTLLDGSRGGYWSGGSDDGDEGDGPSRTSGSSGGRSSGSSRGGSSQGNGGSGGGTVGGGTTSGGGTTGGSGTTGAPSGDTRPYAAELQRCVEKTNQLRAQLGRAPYQRSATLEQYSLEGAEEDSQTNRAHGHFSRTSGGGVSFAENAIPGWDLDNSGGVMGVVEGGLDAMWGEGPGGGHYEAMASNRYTELGCGIVVTADQKVWLLQNFR